MPKLLIMLELSQEMRNRKLKEKKGVKTGEK
jgi:hypothetical protein